MAEKRGCGRLTGASHVLSADGWSRVGPQVEETGVRGEGAGDGGPGG